MLSWLSYLAGWLANAFQNTVQGALWVVRGMIQTMFTWPAWVWNGLIWIFTMAMMVISVSYAAVQIVSTSLSSIVNRVGAWSPASVPGGSGVPNIVGTVDSALSVANTFFPLNELMAFLTVYCQVLLFAALIRTIKAWLPRIAGFGVNS